MAKQKSMNIDQAQAVDEAFIIHLLRTKCRRTPNQTPQEVADELAIVKTRLRMRFEAEKASPKHSSTTKSL
jgi:hypothetical protein